METYREPKKIDPKEISVPETTFIRGIEDQVFQGIVSEVLAEISGIFLPEGNFIDTLLGRNQKENNFTRAITCEQDLKHQSVSVKIEVSIEYGLSLPKKSEEIQYQVAEKITALTGLHVSAVHVVFKNIVPKGTVKDLNKNAFFLGTGLPKGLQETLLSSSKEDALDGF